MHQTEFFSLGVNNFVITIIAKYVICNANPFLAKKKGLL